MTAHPHPARYSEGVLKAARPWLFGRVLDPFGGTGERLRETWDNSVIMDIEPEWAATAGLQADALHLPFAAKEFDCILTSPAYGNRMADHHEAKDDSRRVTYRHVIGHPLHDRNTGRMQWGERYRGFHIAAWREAVRVLRPFGFFLLNVKDHIRGGERQRVAEWHLGVLLSLGLHTQHRVDVPVPGMRFGENHGLRVDYENLFILAKEPNRALFARPSDWRYDRRYEFYDEEENIYQDRPHA